MTKKEFKQFERACKKTWRALAKNGNAFKPRTSFLHSCPACEIACGCDKISNQDCKKCPITSWRKRARENATPIGCSVCSEIVYGKWAWQSDTKEDRKKFALKISKLNWSWIKEYKSIKVEGTRYGFK